MDPFDDMVTDSLRAVTHAGRRIIQTAANYRISCEGWLKLTMVAEFSELSGVTVMPEHSHVDIVLAAAAGTAYLELKTFPTNYGRAGKPITNFIDGVIGDIRKLREVSPPGFGYVAWLAYPVPFPWPAQWQRHLARIASEHVVELSGVEPVRLDDPTARVEIHLMRV